MAHIPGFGELETRDAAVENHAMPAETIELARRNETQLRFGGLTMDARTGTTSWKGKLVALSVEERELLAILMRRAGQILSRERLAASLVVLPETVDQRIHSLRHTLESAGVTSLPYAVDGLGYILWRQ
jgi:DNA-binding response OmpR family regulator